MTSPLLPEQLASESRGGSSGSRTGPGPGEDDRDETVTGVVRVGELAIRLAGIAVRFGDETVTGSAGSLNDDPLPRARAELQERLTLMHAIRDTGPRLGICDAEGRRVGILPRARVFPDDPAPAAWRPARSNGVAAGASWTQAACAARLELLERDRVLRSWYGDVLPIRVFDTGVVPSGLESEYDVQEYLLGGSQAGVSVAAVFAFPRRHGPLVYGFGARVSARDALEAAFRELVQRLGFLWGEELPATSPPIANTPAFHQDHYLYPPNHELIHRWLRGEHARFAGVLDCSPTPREPVYVDLTLPAGPRVAKALPRGHVPLVFGFGHPGLRELPPALGVHPIA